ncbi:acyl-CoA dehydrogenase family protein [Mycolicibacterium sp. 624]|uniref:acyl-CoA dehydrogenase family protein n=1 Tax=Mycolicibacterium sp. 624 TaxID=3156314 RepID=UPI0033965C91
MTTETATVEADILDFVATVRKICESAPTADQWSPTVPGDDRNTLLRTRLTDVGWFDVAAEPYAADILGAAGFELGRALASVDLVDDLLGHGIALGAGVVGDIDLARYRGAGDTVWLCGTAGAELVDISASEPVRYIDAQAVAIITAAPAAAQTGLPGPAVDAWIAAMTGYIAGLAAGALELAGRHAQQRMAFGRPLSDLDAVAKKIADCVTASEGLQMAARRRPDAFVLQQAPVAAFRVMRACHQILGGLGFTLEYPLQRYSRRVEALRAWTPAVVTALAASRADG